MGLAVFGLWMDSMILEAFFNLNYSSFPGGGHEWLALSENQASLPLQQGSRKLEDTNLGKLTLLASVWGDTWNFHFPRKVEISFDFNCYD